MVKQRLSAPRLFHPLCGSDPATLLRLLTTNGGFPANRWPHLATILCSSLGISPLSLVEYLWVRARRDPTPDRPPPIFIVGHWRSGTTHLYNVMSRDPGLGYLPPLETGMPWNMFTVVSALRPLLEKALPEKRYIDNIPVDPESPQEDEIALANMTWLSYYQALYFPRRFDRNFARGLFFDGCADRDIEVWRRRMHHLAKKLSLRWPDRRLLIKNPVYSLRMPLLVNMFPNARFIHIHRNPYVVFQSMRNFYRRLFENFALQDFRHVDIDPIILKTYRRMMETVVRDSGALPANRFAEIRFEDFETNPVAQLKSVYQQLEIDGYSEASPRFNDYLESITGYRKNQYDYSDLDRDLVNLHWREFIERWGYSAP